MPIVTQKISAELLKNIAINATVIGDDDVETLTRQLGREPRGLVGIGARCICGTPLVTVTYPRLPDGSPFPTLFYLSYPWLVKEISRIESAGKMVEFNERLSLDEDLRNYHAQAHREYVRRRNLLAEVSEISDFSAGGMPDRVKCLHALAGYALAVGEGVCRIGDEVLSQIGWEREVCHCSAVENPQS